MEESQRVEESCNSANKLEMDQVMQPSIAPCPSTVEMQLLTTEAGHTGMKTCGH